MGKKTKPAKTKTTTGNAFDPFHLDNGVGFTDTSDSREEKNTGENSPFNPFAEDNELAPSSATTVPFPRHLQEEQRHNEILGMQYSATSSFKNDKTGEARERAKFTSSYDTLEAFEHAFGGGAPTEMFSSKKGPSSSSNERQPTVHVAIHEQLAIAHDSVSSIPAIIVTGTIHVRRKSVVLCNPFQRVNVLIFVHFLTRQLCHVGHTNQDASWFFLFPRGERH